MKRILDVVGMTAGGWLGWSAGSAVSVFTAFVVSMIGTGVGLYVVRRYVTAHLP